MSIVLEEWHPSHEVLQLVTLAKDFAEREHPVTVRQTFYQLVTSGAISNTERAYGRLVKILVRARKAGIIPFDWFTDLTRRPLRLKLCEDVGEFLEEQADRYYRDTWRNQDAYVLVWVEKQALQGVLWPVVGYYNVSLYPGRGYSSWPFIFEALKELQEQDEKSRILLYLGDYDPSGMDIARDLEKRFRSVGVEFQDFTRLALTRAQIEEYKLPPMPVKREDPRCKSFIQEHGGSAVELDALPPSVLRALVKDAIEAHLDMIAFRRDLALERREKEWLLDRIEELRNDFNSS